MEHDPVPGSSTATAYPIPARLLLLLLLFKVPSGTGAELEQDTLIIRGDQTAPRTMYIAPWKRVGEPLPSNPLELELGGEPIPVERDLFIRTLQLQRQGFSVEPPPASLPAGEQASGFVNPISASQE